LKETQTFKSVNTSHQFQIRTTVNCKSSNVVYLIDCSRCQQVQYVGETGQTLQRRFHAHKSNIGVTPGQKTPNKDANINQRPDTLVARHFQGPDHSVLDMRVTVIEQLNTDDTHKRRSRERFWRHKLKTNYPEGLNVWD
jgi:hypothetical protein